MTACWFVISQKDWRVLDELWVIPGWAVHKFKGQRCSRCCFINWLQTEQWAWSNGPGSSQVVGLPLQPQILSNCIWSPVRILRTWWWRVTWCLTSWSWVVDIVKRSQQLTFVNESHITLLGYTLTFEQYIAVTDTLKLFFFVFLKHFNKYLQASKPEGEGVWTVDGVWGQKSSGKTRRRLAKHQCDTGEQSSPEAERHLQILLSVWLARVRLRHVPIA